MDLRNSSLGRQTQRQSLDDSVRLTALLLSNTKRTVTEEEEENRGRTGDGEDKRLGQIDRDKERQEDRKEERKMGGIDR